MKKHRPTDVAEEIGPCVLIFTVNIDKVFLPGPRTHQ